MGIALYTLQASLRKGRYSNYLQWDSMRKTPTWYANAYEAGTEYGNGSMMVQDDRKLFSTLCPSNGKWFSRFMRGAKLRMGVIRRQNEALTAMMILAVLQFAEEDWKSTEDEKTRKQIEEVMVFMLASFCGALRGEEVPLIAIEGLVKFWDETKVNHTPYMMLTLRGRFKGEKELRWHCVPVADYSKDGKLLPVRRWLTRLLSRRVDIEKATTGWLFARKDKSRGKIGDYDDIFKDYLRRVQSKYPQVILPLIDIEDFGLWRSACRGAMTEATINKIDPMIIELINRWRTREAAKGTEPGLPMRQVYTQVASTMGSMIQYSQGLWVRAERGF